MIWLRTFLTLQENLEYLQCVNLSRELNSVRKLKLEKVSSVSILKTLKEFKTNKTIGVESLAGRFLKDGSDTLCTPIAKICNLSIKLSSFPDKFKIAKIWPFYKEGPSRCCYLLLRL